MLPHLVSLFLIFFLRERNIAQLYEVCKTMWEPRGRAYILKYIHNEWSTLNERPIYADIRLPAEQIAVNPWGGKLMNWADVPINENIVLNKKRNMENAGRSFCKKKRSISRCIPYPCCIAMMKRTVKCHAAIIRFARFYALLCDVWSFTSIT